MHTQSLKNIDFLVMAIVVCCIKKTLRKAQEEKEVDGKSCQMQSESAWKKDLEKGDVKKRRLKKIK